MQSKENRVSHSAERIALGVEELASKLGVSKKLVRAAAERGELRTFRLGDRRLVPWSEVERLIEGRPA